MKHYNGALLQESDGIAIHFADRQALTDSGGRLPENPPDTGSQGWSQTVEPPTPHAPAVEPPTPHAPAVEPDDEVPTSQDSDIIEALRISKADEQNEDGNLLEAIRLSEAGEQNEDENLLEAIRISGADLQKRADRVKQYNGVTEIVENSLPLDPQLVEDSLPSDKAPQQIGDTGLDGLSLPLLPPRPTIMDNEQPVQIITDSTDEDDNTQL